MARRLVRVKVDWRRGRITFYKRVKRAAPSKRSTAQYLKYKDAAYNLVVERINHFNVFYQFTYNRIAIRNQKTRWGSCSKKGNLNFNYKIALLPSDVADYIIVHELCHLAQFNHSKEFWALVAKTTPDYKTIRSSLREHGAALR